MGTNRTGQKATHMRTWYIIEVKVQSKGEKLDYSINGAGSISYPYKEKLDPSHCTDK